MLLGEIIYHAVQMRAVVLWIHCLNQDILDFQDGQDKAGDDASKDTSTGTLMRRPKG